MSRSRASLLLGLFATAGLACIAVPEAEARAFYTMRRVNGEWVKGVYPFPEGTAAAPTRPRPVAKARVRRTYIRPRAMVRRPVSVPRGPVAAALVAAPQSSGPEKTVGDDAASVTSSTIPLAEPQTARIGDRLPVSVSMDFATGVKTTWFADGSVVEEPFETATRPAEPAVAAPLPSR